MAVGDYGEVELRSLENHAPARKWDGHQGNVNAVLFSPDGSFFAASGEPRNQRRSASMERRGRHIDSHVSPAIKTPSILPPFPPMAKYSPRGVTIKKIKLWNVETGQKIKTLSGHNGAIFGLAFRPDGKVLASASGDRTVKLWEVASGDRRDTLSQSLKELYAVAFSPDGKRLMAGGVDNRIRIWQISESAARETTNPLLDSKLCPRGGDPQPCLLRGWQVAAFLSRGPNRKALERRQTNGAIASGNPAGLGARSCLRGRRKDHRRGADGWNAWIL